eukprot:scaffold130736_cov22-Tisochrysis_lutea.AAC.1
MRGGARGQECKQAVREGPCRASNACVVQREVHHMWRALRTRMRVAHSLYQKKWCRARNASKVRRSVGCIKRSMHRRRGCRCGYSVHKGGHAALHVWSSGRCTSATHQGAKAYIPQAVQALQHGRARFGGP